MRIEVGVPAPTEQGWLAADHIESVFVTSQQAEYPIDSIFADDGAGWRAESPGTQVIRILFDSPRQIRRIQLEFSEDEVERTQEFVLYWAATEDGPRNELLRQQWNFSPHGSTSETEDIRVDLNGVLLLELVLTPDVGKGPAIGKLRRFRIK
jgi:hypothetical protein